MPGPERPVPAEPPSAGARVTDRFAIDAEVGHGSSGVVFRGHDRATGAPVAVKRVHAHLDGTDARARLAREAALLARVASPHVVRCLAHGVDDEGRACLVLAWIDGEDLGKRLAAGPPPVGEAIAIGLSAARAVAALHEAGVVHGDVKPSNFLVSAGPPIAVTLVDLGFARAGEAPSPGEAGAMLGTPSRFAPEQVRTGSAATPSSDQFALGLVLYELVSGRRPFEARETAAVLARIALAEPPPLDEAAPATPPALAAIVARALAKEPAARFPSVRALADALAAVTTVDAARPAPAPPRARPAVAVVFAKFAADHAGTTEGGWRRDETPPPPGSLAPGGADAFEAIANARGGATHRFVGGRAIALFGGVDDRDAATRAIAAALAAVPLRGARLAVATGTAGANGGPVDDDTLDRGSASLALAHPGEVRVDEPTARAIAGRVPLEPVEGGACVRAEHRDDRG